jgi:hypothetical protein
VTNSPKHAAIRHRIEEIGIIPSIRTRSAEGARFAAETIAEAGIPIVEITMTVPDALRVVAELRRRMPDLIVGADSAWDLDGECAENDDENRMASRRGALAGLHGCHRRCDGCRTGTGSGSGTR